MGHEAVLYFKFSENLCKSWVLSCQTKENPYKGHGESLPSTYITQTNRHDFSLCHDTINTTIFLFHCLRLLASCQH